MCIYIDRYSDVYIYIYISVHSLFCIDHDFTKIMVAICSLFGHISFPKQVPPKIDMWYHHSHYCHGTIKKSDYTLVI